MGGFWGDAVGAKYPERFRSFAGHSSITEVAQMAQFVEEDVSVYCQDDPNEGSVLAQILKNKAKLPAFRFDCGLGDDLLYANRTLHQNLSEHAVPHEYEEFSGGHEWPYWEKHIEKTLLFFNRIG